MQPSIATATEKKTQKTIQETPAKGGRQTTDNQKKTVVSAHSMEGITNMYSLDVHEKNELLKHIHKIEFNEEWLSTEANSNEDSTEMLAKLLDKDPFALLVAKSRTLSSYSNTCSSWFLLAPPGSSWPLPYCSTSPLMPFLLC